MLRLALCFFLLSCYLTKLQAEPSYMAFGYNSCLACHHSPSGGGARNGYGKNFMTPLLTGKNDILNWIKSENTADEEEKAQDEGDIQFELGLEARLLLYYDDSIKESKDRKKFRAIPMLIEPHTVISKGPWKIYLTASARKEYTAKGDKYSLFSREHWLLFQTASLHFFRIGRMTIPFGLRTPDHTRLTRQNMSLLQYDQEYGIAWDYWTNSFNSFFFAYLGNHLVGKSQDQKKGAVLTLEKTLLKSFVLGSSFLYDEKKSQSRKAVSFFTRIKPFDHHYILGEFNYLQTKNPENTSAKIPEPQTTSFARYGVFLKEWVDLYGQIGISPADNDYSIHRQLRAGLKFRIYRWLETELSINQKSSKKQSSDSFSLQIHGFIN